MAAVLASWKWFLLPVHYAVFFCFVSEGSTFPTHWYRMKAFDEAANFGELIGKG